MGKLLPRSIAKIKNRRHIEIVLPDNVQSSAGLAENCNPKGRQSFDAEAPETVIFKKRRKYGKVLRFLFLL
jgi:hypothetical protein